MKSKTALNLSLALVLIAGYLLSASPARAAITPCHCPLYFKTTTFTGCTAANVLDQQLKALGGADDCDNLCLKTVWYATNATLCSRLMETQPTIKLPFNGFVQACSDAQSPAALYMAGRARAMRCPPTPGGY